jgi:hypothetical protein
MIEEQVPVPIDVDFEVNVIGDPLAPTVQQIHEWITSALSVPQELLRSEESTRAEVAATMEHYLHSLKDQGHLENFSLQVGYSYIITGYHITKHNQVIEHRCQSLSGETSEGVCDHRLIAKLQGPHKPRRELHKAMKRWVVGGIVVPVDTYVQPKKPLEFVNFTVNVV